VRSQTGLTDAVFKAPPRSHGSGALRCHRFRAAKPGHTPSAPARRGSLLLRNLALCLLRSVPSPLIHTTPPAQQSLLLDHPCRPLRDKMAVNRAGKRARSDGEEERTTAGCRLTEGDVGRPGSGTAGGDEVPPAPAPGTDSSAKGKQRRRLGTDTHDLRVVRATRAANAHVAPRRKIM